MSEQMEVVSGGEHASEVSFKENHQAPASSSGTESQKSDVNNATPTPLKKKKSVPLQLLETPDKTVTPGKGQVIATYAEWVKQNKSASKSAVKSASDLTSKADVKSAPASSAKSASNSAAKASPRKPKSIKKKQSNTEKGESKIETGPVSADSTPILKTGAAKRKSGKMTANKLKKIQELTEREKTQRVSLEKLKRSHNRLEKELAMKEQVKFPVPDEDIVAIDKQNGKPSPLPMPKNEINFPPHLVADLLFVWDFLHAFRKEISLREFELDEFIDVLSYTLDHSTVLTEIYCALLRTILGDAYTCQRLVEELPKELHFAFRGDLVRKTTTGESNSEDPHYSQLCPTFALSTQFDSSCAALKLLNARHPLSNAEVDALKWQAILRAVFPRLDTFRDLQRARDIEGDLAASRYECEGIDGEGHKTYNLDYKMKLTSFDAYAIYPQQTILEYLNSQIASYHSSKDTSELPEKMEIVNNSSNASEEVAVSYYSMCLDAIKAMQEKEFHELNAELKLIVLKHLVLTCYESETIQNKVSNNAEERANEIANNNKLKWEEKRRIREASNSMKDTATERCRAMNQKDAGEKEAGTGKKSVQKKLDFKQAGANKLEDFEETGIADGGKKGKNVKSNYDPTPAQLSAMLEEMVMLNSFGIDMVLPTAPDLDPVSDNEEDGDDGTDLETKKLIDALAGGRSSRDRGVSSRSSQKSARDRDRERNQRRAERTATLKAREQATAYCIQATQSRREKDVKEAIKVAKSCGIQGRTVSGDNYVTEELKKVYEVQYQLDLENKEAAQAQKLEKALAELFVRTEPIGQDRYFRSYWCFEGDDRLFMQSERGTTDLIKLAIDNGLDVQKVLRDKKKKTKNHLESAVAAELASEIPLLQDQNRPARHDYVWSVFRSTLEIWHLVEALDERGHRERALKNSIKARFDLQGEAPVPSVYLTEGSPYIGMKVKRCFGKGVDRYIMIGVITGWLPPVIDGSNSEPAFWHVMHCDGDSEDLDEKEVKKGLIGTVPKVDYLEPLANIMEIDDGVSQQTEKKTTRSLIIPKIPSSDDLNAFDYISSGEKDMQLMPFLMTGYCTGEENSAILIRNKLYQPAILRNYSNTYRGGLAFKHYTIGVAGLRTELLGLMNKLIEGLKMRGSQWIRSSTKRTWEVSVRDAVSTTEFRSLLAELECVVRETQKIEDIKRDEELEKMRLNAQKGLEAEGWVFSKEQLVDNSDYMAAVKETLCDCTDNDGKVEGGKKRKRDEADSSSIMVCAGEPLHPSLPSLKVEVNVEVSALTVKAICGDIEGAEFIGITVRRFFRNTVPSDGTVLAYLPSFLNEGDPLWHVLHDDGDEEDLNHAELLRGARAFEKKLDAPEDEDVYDDENEVDDDVMDEANDEGSSQSDSGEEDGSENGFEFVGAEDPNTLRLWPSAFVRANWCNAISECKTLAEVALGLTALSQQCSEYGILLQDPGTVSSKRISKPVNRTIGSHSSKKRRFSLTPVKPKSSHNRGAIRTSTGGNTPAKKKKKKVTSRKSMGGGADHNKHFNSFGFFPGDRPVRGSRREVCYAE